MAEIRPFKGLRYSSDVVKRIEEVATPPYDVISPDAQRMYYARSEHNVIRLELGMELAGDSPQDNRYTRSRDLFLKWLAGGVLLAERKPSMYLYQHEFAFRGEKRTRRGLIAGLRLEDLDAGVVLPHEETLDKPLTDRLNLMRACHANFSPVFGLFQDESDRVSGVLGSVASSPPVRSLVWDEGSVHSLWVIDQPELLTTLAEALEPSRVFIADGHHRYKTALRYRDEARSAVPRTSGEEAFDFVMALLVGMDDPGLVVLPTHRLVRNSSHSPSSIERSLSEWFEVRHFPADGEPVQRVAAMLKEMEEAKSANVFGVFGLRKGSFSLLFSRNDGRIHRVMPRANSPAWRALDVSVLRFVVFERVLGVREEAAVHDGTVEYVSDEGDAVRAVLDGRASMAWFLRPATVKQVHDVALASDRMPHKSTYFHPKPLTGLVLNHLEGDLPRLV